MVRLGEYLLQHSVLAVIEVNAHAIYEGTLELKPENFKTPLRPYMTLYYKFNYIDELARKFALFWYIKSLYSNHICLFFEFHIFEKNFKLFATLFILIFQCQCQNGMLL